MPKNIDRLDLVAEDIEYVEKHNQITDHQRLVIHDFEWLMISAELEGNTRLFSIYRYRLVRYLGSEHLKHRSL